jgi:hypothetical protein
MSEDANSGAAPSGGVQRRRRILSTVAAELDFMSDAEFPDVWGTVVDFSVGEAIATVVALRDGTASLYTTSSFGVVGGHRYEPVRRAAVECAAVAGEVFGEAADEFAPADDYSYPDEGEIFFYLLTYDGLLRGSAPEDAIYAQTHPLTSIFAFAQGVLTQLRLASDQE